MGVPVGASLGVPVAVAEIKELMGGLNGTVLPVLALAAREQTMQAENGGCSCSDRNILSIIESFPGQVPVLCTRFDYSTFRRGSCCYDMCFSNVTFMCQLRSARSTRPSQDSWSGAVVFTEGSAGLALFKCQVIAG